MKLLQETPRKAVSKFRADDGAGLVSIKPFRDVFSNLSISIIALE